MATTKQRRVAKLIIENATLDKPMTGGEIVEKSGYGESMKLYPARIIDTEGVKEALNDYGFSEDNAKMVVAEILLKQDARDADRLKAADMVFEVQGSKAPAKTINLHGQVGNEDVDALRAEYEEKLRAKLQQ